MHRSARSMRSALSVHSCVKCGHRKGLVRSCQSSTSMPVVAESSMGIYSVHPLKDEASRLLCASIPHACSAGNFSFLNLLLHNCVVKARRNSRSLFSATRLAPSALPLRYTSPRLRARSVLESAVSRRFRVFDIRPPHREPHKPLCPARVQARAAHRPAVRLANHAV